jgi:hypothetical protein
MGMSTVLTAAQAVPPVLPRHTSPGRRKQLEADHDLYHEGQRRVVEGCPLCVLQKQIDAISKPQKAKPEPEPVIVGTWIRIRGVHSNHLIWNERLKKWEAHRTKDGVDVLLGRAETREAAARIYRADVQAEQTNAEHLCHHLHSQFNPKCKFCLLPGLAREAGFDR